MINRNSLKKHRRLVLAWVSVLSLCLTMCTSQASQTPGPTPASGSVYAYQSTSGDISSNGVLLPARQIELGFGVGGVVESIAVEIGEQVQAGQTLAQLDATQARLALAGAETELEAAQASYALLESGSAPDQAAIAIASLELLNAQQAVDALYERASGAQIAALQEIADASRAVEEIENHLYYFAMPSSLAGLGSLEALDVAREALDQARADYEPYKYTAESDDLTQDETDEGDTRQRLKEALDRALGNYAAAIRRVELEAALAAAEARLEAARGDYETLGDGPHHDELALAEARLASAQAQFDLASAQGPAPEQLALAQAHVDAARLNLQLAQAQLDRTTITAPIDGVVSAIRIDAYEWTAPGVAIIELLDVSYWRVETRNVGELQIGRVELGQAVNVLVNAFQDQTLSGHVVEIHPASVVQQGDVTYTLIIELEPTDLNLRHGMTARVEILVED